MTYAAVVALIALYFLLRRWFVQKAAHQPNPENVERAREAALAFLNEKIAALEEKKAETGAKVKRLKERHAEAERRIAEADAAIAENQSRMEILEQVSGNLSDVGREREEKKISAGKHISSATGALREAIERLSAENTDDLQRLFLEDTIPELKITAARLILESREEPVPDVEEVLAILQPKATEELLELRSTQDQRLFPGYMYVLLDSVLSERTAG